MTVTGILTAGSLALVVLFAPAFAAIETVKADDIDSLIRSQRGILVLSLSSTDPKCQPCMGANAKFQILSLGSNTVRFVQVTWQPWREFPVPVRSLLAKYDLPSSVPIRLAFEDGKLLEKQLGEPAMPSQPRTFPQTGRVEVIEPLDADRRVKGTTGISVVMLSSFEPDCAFCMRANPAFEELAAGRLPASPTVKFMRVMYRPWTSAGTDPFGKLIGVGGLPVYLTFKDGKPVRRHNGTAEAGELRKKLLEGLN